MREFILEHEIGHIEQIEDDGSFEKMKKGYAADPVAYELDANLRALKALKVPAKKGDVAPQVEPTEIQEPVKDQYLAEHEEKVNQRNLAQEKEAAERKEAKSTEDWNQEKERLEGELDRVNARLARNPKNTLAAQRKLDIESELVQLSKTDMKTFVIGDKVQAEDLAYSSENIYPEAKQLRHVVESLIDAVQGRNLLKLVGKLTGAPMPKVTSEINYPTSTLQSDVKTSLESLDKTELIDLIEMIQSKATTKADKASLKDWQESQYGKAHNSAQVVQETVESLNVVPMPVEEVDPTFTLKAEITQALRVTDNLFKTGLQRFRQSKLWQSADSLSELSSLKGLEYDTVVDTLEGLGFNPRTFNKADWVQLQYLGDKRTWFNEKMDLLASQVRAIETSVYASGANKGKRKNNDPRTSNQNVLRDLMVQDAQGNWTFPPRIKDAAFLAYYSLGSSVSPTRYNDDLSLQGILGENSNQKVRAHADYDFMKVAGTPISKAKAEDAFRNMLGAEMKTSAPQSTLDGIVTAMGSALLSTLDTDPEISSYNPQGLKGNYGRIYTYANAENNKFIAKVLADTAKSNKVMVHMVLGEPATATRLFTQPHIAKLPEPKGIIGQVGRPDYA
ncbi:MAG: hypothetical protein ACPH0A_08180, partial [Candidatus Poseidoniaceae archaeon]